MRNAEVDSYLATVQTNEVRDIALACARELSKRWIEQMPQLRPHINAGATCAVEIEVTAPNTLSLMLIDSNSRRVQVAYVQRNASAAEDIDTMGGFA